MRVSLMRASNLSIYSSRIDDKCDPIAVASFPETPCILFGNRMDEPRGRLRDVVAALQDYANHTLLLRQIPIREGDRIIGSCDLISERAWRYREGQTSALIAIPENAAEREHEVSSWNTCPNSMTGFSKN